MNLIKEYVITEISASYDGSPSVMIALKDPSDVKGPQKQLHTPTAVTFTSMNELMNNFGNVISKQMRGNFVTIIKITLDEYEKSDFKVGDRISVEIKKTITGS